MQTPAFVDHFGETHEVLQGFFSMPSPDLPRLYDVV